MHHTQLLARLVEDGKLTPVNAVDEKITYHDPCFLGRHNKVFTPPRAIIDARARHQRRGDGPLRQPRLLLRGGRRPHVAGGADRHADQRRPDRRGPRPDPDIVATACPYCMVMLGDAVNAKKATGQAKETLEVIDVAQLLVRAVRLREGTGRRPDGPRGRPARSPDPN